MKDMKNMSVSPIALALIVIVVGAGAFFGGTKYQQKKTAQFAGRFGGAPGSLGNRGGQGRPVQNIRPVNGEIISADEKSITVKLIDGSTKIVLLSDSTTINKAADATKSDLKAGEQVGVFGAQNSDGSVTAQSIQLNPMFRMGANATPSATTTVKQ
ncbi:MAG: DUF5666 domain-containing protein [Patescibacteria group bacterium]